MTQTPRSLWPTFGPLFTLALAFCVPCVHVAYGYQIGTPVIFGTASPDPDNPVEYDWHSRGTWGLSTDWLNPGDPRFDVTIPGLPTDYNPDYNNPATIDPNDPGTGVLDPNALGPNPADFRALSPPSFIHRATVHGSPDFSVSIINVDHNVALGVRTDYFGNTDVQQTSIEVGGSAFGGLDSFNVFRTVTSDINWRNGDFSADGSVWLGSLFNDYEATLNLTSSGTFQVGSSAPAAGAGLATHSDALLRVGRGQTTSPATVNQSAGNAIISGGLVVASTKEGSRGIYNLSGGSLTLETLDPAADELADIDLGASDNSLGTFNQTGGTVTTDSRVVIGGFAGETFFGSLFAEQGSGVYNISAASAGTDGDYNEDNVVDAADYTVWRDNEGAAPGTLPNDADGGVIGSAQYDTWVANFGNTGGGGGTTTLNQGVGTSNGGDDKGKIVVGLGGHGTLNVDASAGDVLINAAAIDVALFAQVTGSAGTAGDATGLFKITGAGATITVADTLTVGDGAATFEYISASGISSIDVGGDVDIDGAALIVDLLTSAPGAGDLLLIEVGGALTGTFTGLSEGAIVGGTGGYTITYNLGGQGDIGLLAPPSSFAVPEPTSAVLSLLASLGVVGCGRRHRYSHGRK